MLTRLVVPAFIVGSAVALITPSVNAQSVNLQFRGTMPPPSINCTFGTPDSDILVPEGRTTLTSTGAVRVTLRCLAPATITLSAPIQTSGPSFSPDSCRVAMNQQNPAFPGPTGFAYTSCTGTSPPTPVANTVSTGTLVVSMTVASTSGIPVGDYAYNVTVSIVP
jgi:hypothetical protein